MMIDYLFCRQHGNNGWMRVGQTDIMKLASKYESFYYNNVDMRCKVVIKLRPLSAEDIIATKELQRLAEFLRSNNCDVEEGKVAMKATNVKPPILLVIKFDDSNAKDVVAVLKEFMFI